jgi:transglutaminase-like putative cysteine protease
LRFGIVHRVMTDALATLGILAVVSTTTMSPWTNAVLLIGLAAALAIPESWQSRPTVRHFANAAPIALAVAQGVRLMAGRPPLDVAIEFAALLQIIRLATRRGAAHDQQIIVLSLLHFVAGTVLGGGLTYGLCFLGFLIVAPGALVLSHLRREVEGNYRQGARDRTGLPVDVPRILRSRRVVGKMFLGATCLLSVPIFLFTAALFVIFPRVGLSLLLLNHPHSGHMVGFSDRVDLGDVGVLRSDPSIALRFERSDMPDPPPPRMTLRLRGTAFDSYDGRAWARTQTARFPAEHDPNSPETYQLVQFPDRHFSHPNAKTDAHLSIDLEPIDPTVIFLPPRTVNVFLRPQGQSLLGEPLALYRGPEGEFRYSGPDSRGLHYDVYTAPDNEAFVDRLSASDRQRYLETPATLPPRIAALAEEWTANFATDDEKARALVAHLHHEYKYDINSPSGGKEQPLDHFLFESRRGHCEFFSTAMAMMLRKVGIPSRNVTGFVGGTYNRFGRYYAVREGDAHSWVEAYIGDPDHGTWVTFDPTPPAGAQPLEATTGALVYVRDLIEALSQRWNSSVVNYNLQTQVRIYEDLARRYDSFRSKAGVSRGPLDRLTRAPVVAGGLLALFAVAYAVWRRARMPRKAGQLPKGTETEARLLDAAALYRSLEGALMVQGLARPVALPPLRHAEHIVEKNHPLAAETLSLTETYLDVRFGHGTLTDETKRDFERRVRKIRSFKANPAESARA